MNLRITNQPRQDYPFKGCKTIEDNTDSSEVVKCSPVKKNFKIPNKKEEQTVACFKKVVFSTVKGPHLKCAFLNPKRCGLFGQLRRRGVQKRPLRDSGLWML